jgi:hypothetical protein
MSRAGAAFTAAALLLAGCGGRVWQAPEPMTPVSYQHIDQRVDRSVGRLRRLALPPVHVDVTLPLFDGAFSKTRSAAAGAAVARIWGSETARVLEVKGYEVVQLDLYEDMAEAKLGVSWEQAVAHLDELATWARTSADGEPPPERVTAALTAVVRRLGVDGLVIVQGSRRAANVSTVLTILTASATWPLMFAEGRETFRADIFEVATGRIVWRGTAWHHLGTPGGQSVPLVTPTQVFEMLEPAIPKVLTE